MVGDRRSASHQPVMMILAFFVDEVPSLVGGACNERLDKVDTEETKEVYKGGDEGKNSCQFGESDDVKGNGVTDLVPRR